MVAVPEAASVGDAAVDADLVEVEVFVLNLFLFYFSFSSSYFFWVAPWDFKKPVLRTLTSVCSLNRKEMSGIKTPSCLGLFYTFCD